MTEIIAGIEIPDTATAAAATSHVRETAGPLLYHHSRRVFLFASLHARTQRLAPDPELLYVAAMFHDTGLHTPAPDAVERFEIDGADNAHRFLLEHGASREAADLVWSAVALHTTPGVPDRMAPEIALTHRGVLTDAVGAGLDDLARDAVDEIVIAHPRDGFKDGFLRALHEGIRHRPDTAYGTVNADVLEHFDPHVHRATLVDRVLGSPWSE